MALLLRTAIAITSAALVISPGMAAASSGTIKIDAAIMVDKNVPSNTVITARGYVNENGTTSSHGASSSVTVTFKPGQTAHATIMLPYTWTATAGATVRVSLLVSSNAQNLPNPEDSRVIPLPANGSTVTVDLPAAI